MTDVAAAGAGASAVAGLPLPQTGGAAARSATAVAATARPVWDRLVRARLNGMKMPAEPRELTRTLSDGDFSRPQGERHFEDYRR